MPTFIIAALAAGGAAGLGTVIATGAEFAFSWAAFGATLVLGGLSRALAKNPRAPTLNGADARGRNVTIRQPLAPWQIVFGECRAGGVLTYAMEADTGNFLMVVTFTGHPVQQITDIRFGDEVIPYNAVTGAATGRHAGNLVVFTSKG